MELHVRILSAQNIPKMDAGKSDPYIKIFINGRTPHQATKIVHETETPEWNEEFHFDVLSYGYDLLTLQMFDEDCFADDAMGVLTIKLLQLPPGLVVHDWYQLAASPKCSNPGQVLLDLHVALKGSAPFVDAPFQPLTLRFTIAEARGLANADTVGKSDPFAIAQLEYSPASFKTKTKDNTLTPLWNETSSFPITAPASDILNVKVLDEDVRANDDLASVAILLAPYADGEVHDQWFELVPAEGVAKGGEIRLLLKIEPSPPFTPAAHSPGNLGAIRFK
jgi:Ca2+-dependent lipid-binding protein